MHGDTARFRRSKSNSPAPDELRTEALREFYTAALQNLAISNASPSFDSGGSAAVERAANCVGVPVADGEQIAQLERLNYAVTPAPRSRRLYSDPPVELRQALVAGGVEWHTTAAGDARRTAEARRAPSFGQAEEPLIALIDGSDGVDDGPERIGGWEWFEEWEALPSGGFTRVSSAADSLRAEAAISAVDAYASGCAFAVELAEQAWNRMLARSQLEREAKTARFRAYLRQQHKTTRPEPRTTGT
jgi:hypothetical protein